jgi:hypothetical protein
MSGQTDLCATCRVLIEWDYDSKSWKDLHGRSYTDHKHLDFFDARKEAQKPIMV